MFTTLTTHFIEGTPQGIQSFMLSNRSVMAFIIPRASITKIKEITELKNTSCLYLLLEETNDNIKPQVYIGQSDDFTQRVNDHQTKKEFWDKALIFTSTSGELHKTSVMYLEYLALKKAKHLDRVILSNNKQQPKEPNLLTSKKASLNEFFSYVEFISNFVGQLVFADNTLKDNDKKLLFSTKSSNSDAQGFYDEKGFTVLAGSIFSKKVTPSFNSKEKRQQFIELYTETINNHITLSKNYTFKSPSTAASYVLGRSANGWITWFNKEGLTLDEVLRSKID